MEVEEMEEEEWEGGRAGQQHLWVGPPPLSPGCAVPGPGWVC